MSRKSGTNLILNFWLVSYSYPCEDFEGLLCTFEALKFMMLIGHFRSETHILFEF